MSRLSKKSRSVKLTTSGPTQLVSYSNESRHHSATGDSSYQAVNIVGVLGRSPTPPPSPSPPPIPLSPPPHPSRTQESRRRDPLLPLQLSQPAAASNLATYTTMRQSAIEQPSLYTIPLSSPPRDRQGQQQPLANENTPLMQHQATDDDDRVLYDIYCPIRGCLGMGHWYSVLCLFFSFLLFVGAAIIIGIVAATKEVENGDTTRRIIGCALSAMVLILVGSIRPLAKLCTRITTRPLRRKRALCGLIIYSWIVTAFYGAAVGVLATSANYKCIVNCKETNYVDRMAVWLMIAMVLIPTVMFSFLGIVCVCKRCKREN